MVAGLLFLAGPSVGQVEVPGESVGTESAVRVGADASPLDLLPLMMELRRDWSDPGDAASVMGAEGWVTTGDRQIASVFEPVALWLRVPLVNPSDVKVTRIVTIAPWRIGDVTVSLWNEATGVAEPVARLGWNQPEWQTGDGLDLTARIELDPGERRMLLVRLRDRTIGTVAVSLMTEAQAENARLQRFLLQTAVLSSILVLAFFLIVQRDWTYLFAAGYFAFSGIFELSYDYWLVFWLFPGLLPYMVPVMLVSAAAFAVLFVLWSLTSFQGKHERIWVRALLVWVAALAATVIWSLLTEQHEQPRRVFALLAVCGFVFWPVSFFWLSKLRIERFRRTMIGLFVACWCAQLVRAAAAGGLLPALAFPWTWALPLLVAYLTVLSILLLSASLQRSERERLAAVVARARERELAGNLSAGIVHDINNLLAILSLDVQLLKSGFEREDAAVRDQMLDEVEHVAGQAATLTRGILLLGGTGPLPREFRDIRVLVEESVAMLTEALPAEIYLELRLPARPLMVETNDTALQLSLLNLIFNARDAMTSGGRIVISVVEAEHGEPGPPDIGRQPSGVHVCLSVCDDGSGIDPEMRDRLFDPLASTKPAGRGHGLGLFMVAQFVERADMGLRIDSRPGVGTCMHLLFPTDQEEQQDAVRPPRPRPSATGADSSPR